MRITIEIVIFITSNKVCCNVITIHLFINLVVSYNIRMKLNIYFRKYLTHIIIFHYLTHTIIFP